MRNSIAEPWISGNSLADKKEYQTLASDLGGQVIGADSTSRFSKLGVNVCVNNEVEFLREQLSILYSENNNLAKKLAKVRHESLHDELTNLPNRRLLVDRFNKVLESGKDKNTYSALLFFDLDGFKSINDIYGHLVGDQILVEVARRIRKSIRATDTLARIGGDEFVALLANLKDDKSNASRKIELISTKILKNVSGSIKIKAQGEVRVLSPLCKLSIGANIFTSDITDQKKYLEKILAIADKAMLYAKSMGGNQIQIN